MPNRNQQPSPSQSVVAALVLIQFLFGMNYFFSKAVLAFIPPLLWASARALTTAALLVVIAKVMGKLDLRRGLYYYKQLILFSLLGVAINQGCFLMGLRYTTPTNSALLNTLIPIFTILIVAIRGQESVSPVRAIGFLCAFVGVLLVHKSTGFSVSDKTFLGDLLTLISVISYSLFLAFSHRFFEKLDFVWATTWLFVYGAITLTIVAVPEYSQWQWQALPSSVWACMLITIIGGTVVPYLLISFTLSKTQSSLVALFIYIQPLVAAVTSYLFYNETISFSTIFAGVLIFTGVFLAITQKTFSRAVATENEATTLPVRDNIVPFVRRNK